MQRSATAGLAAAGVAVVAAIAVHWSGPDERERLKADDPLIVARGRSVYREHCAACHGTSLEGQPEWQTRKADGRLPAPPHDESGHTWHHSDEILMRIMVDGVRAFTGPDYATDMPVYGTVLPREDIIAVLSFIKSTWPADVRERHDRMNTAAARD